MQTRDQFCISIWDLFRPRCQTGKTVRYSNAVTTVEGIEGEQPDFFQLQRIKISGKDSLFAVKLRLKLGKREG